MKLVPALAEGLPKRVIRLIGGADVYDSSCASGAKTLFVDRGNGYFLKIDCAGSLKREAELTAYFHSEGFSPRVTEYFTEGEADYLLTEAAEGGDGISEKFLSSPEELCRAFARSLAELHSADFSRCPFRDVNSRLFNAAESGAERGVCDYALLRYCEFSDAAEAIEYVRRRRRALDGNAPVHGDACLPNIILRDDFSFSAFVDVGSGGVGDRHWDVFWAVWTLFFNLGTDEYRELFIREYGLPVDGGLLRLCGALAALGE